jgi:predicted RNA binding protein YcfA (HicA-like mRNA interferase family)
MGERLPVISAREAVRALEKADFFIHHTTGSHAQLKHKTNAALRVTVPMHGKDLPRRTLRSIIRQAGLTVEQFVTLLRE